MNSRFFSQASRRVFSLPSRVAGVGVLCLPLTGTAATIIKTSDPTVVAAFQSGASVENFDDLAAFVITSYDPGQFIDAGAKFSSRDGATMPTYHSGGASPNDPVGNPGTPIGIVDPDGGIAGDVASPNNVAAPLVINSDELFNNAFMEIIFPTEVSRVGFWVTHGSVSLDLRDSMGSSLPSASTTATSGEFVGITRDLAEVKIAAIIGDGVDAFTIDDVTYSANPTGSTTVPEPGSSLVNIALAALGVFWFRRRLRGC
jgi:hypothetical protein